jgi:signal transduction histidine kinase
MVQALRGHSGYRIDRPSPLTQMLYEFVAANREDIVRRCRARIAARSMPPHTEAEIEHGVPLFLDQLVDALRGGHSSSAAIDRSAVLHGHDLLRRGFTIAQVVYDYGDVCQSITELALERGAPISTDDFRMLNGCLDNAIAAAVTQYGHERQQANFAEEALRANARVGFFAHELRNLIQTALIAFNVVKSGNVGVGGSTGAVLHRSLVGAGDLISRSLAEVRLMHGDQQVEKFSVAALFEELVPAATLSANAYGVTLSVAPVDASILVEADRQVLRSVVMNILQNAFKFTHHQTTVILRAEAMADRALIEVEDHCGGLSDNIDELFQPFEQRSEDQTGLGLGLAFSRWATEANHGRLCCAQSAKCGLCVYDRPSASLGSGAGGRSLGTRAAERSVQ